ncbi:unnamed protein product [Echinostoma caproni]|uniref:Uncharacterized protein n=1 Tax=Echinostoma caproni TaxID=27848 RepID=A0A183B6R7_9TREM|nr:unnamed protein product [Echinostoma caproni]
MNSGQKPIEEPMVEKVFEPRNEDAEEKEEEEGEVLLNGQNSVEPIDWDKFTNQPVVGETTTGEDLYFKSWAQIKAALQHYNLRSDDLVDKAELADRLIDFETRQQHVDNRFIITEEERRAVAADFIPISRIKLESSIAHLTAPCLRQLLVTHPKNVGVELSREQLIYQVKRQWKKYHSELFRSRHPPRPQPAPKSCSIIDCEQSKCRSGWIGMT